MFFNPLTRFVVHALDVVVELRAIHAPNAATTDLHRGQFLRSNQRVDLRNADVEVRGYFFKGEQARLHRAGAAILIRKLMVFRHANSLTSKPSDFIGLFAITPV